MTVSTGVSNCIVLYLHLKDMSYCKYAINYSNHRNIRYFRKRSFISLASDLLVMNVLILFDNTGNNLTTIIIHFSFIITLILHFIAKCFIFLF